MLIPDIDDCISLKCRFSSFGIKSNKPMRADVCENKLKLIALRCAEYGTTCCFLCTDESCKKERHLFNNPEVDEFKVLVFKKKYAMMKRLEE